MKYWYYKHICVNVLILIIMLLFSSTYTLFAQETTEYSENDPMYYVNQAFKLDNFELQEPLYLKALELDPEHVDTLTILMSMYIAVAISEEAKCNYEKAYNSTQKGIEVMHKFITSIEKSPDTKDPEVVAVLPQVKERLASAEERELNLREKLAKEIPCENN